MNATDAPGGALGALMSALIAAPLTVAQSLTDFAGNATSGGCQIPPPCWEPRPAGSCHLILVAGGSALIRVTVNNCGWQSQVVQITAGGMLAAWLTFEPTTLVLPPQSSATFRVTVHAPQQVPNGFAVSGPLLIRGCRDHGARVRITIADCAGPNCCDLVIDDCADHVHHWYDHFYCPRPCNRTRTPGTVPRG
jgi:hypothetical protein